MPLEAFTTTVLDVVDGTDVKTSVAGDASSKFG